MPAVRSSKRERFCLFMAQGMRQTMAAKEAGFAVPKTQANKLMRLPEIKARVAELGGKLDLEKVRAIVRTEMPTREYVLKGLIENVEAAKEVGDRSSVNKGLELIGKEIGMFVQRNMQVDSPLQRLPADKLVQLLQLIDGVLVPTPAPATIDAVVESTEPTDRMW